MTKAKRASKIQCCSFFPYNICDTVDMKWKGSVVRSIKMPTKHDQDKRHTEWKVIFSSQMNGSLTIGGLATKTCEKNRVF